MEKLIIRECYQRRIDLPDKIAAAPELLSGLELFLVAFLDLESSRSYGMSAMPIPWTVIHEYCETMSIKGQQRDDMFFHLRTMDNHYLKYLQRKSKNDS